MAKDLIGHEPFAVILSDDVVVSDRPCIGQLIDAYHRTHASVVAVRTVPHEQTRRYGIVAGTAQPDGLVDVTTMIEKPPAAQAPSRLAVAGRYVLTPGVFERIRRGGRGAGGEIQLTDGIAGLIGTEKVFAYPYQGKRYDCGSKLGFLEATVELALHHPEVGADFTAYLAQRR